MCLFVDQYMHCIYPICLFACLSVHPSVCLSVQLSVHPSVCPSVSLSVCLSVHLSISLSVSLSICHPSVHPPVCLSVCLSVTSFCRFSICLSVCPPIHLSLSVHLSVSVSDCLSISLSICPSVCLSVCLSVCPWMLVSLSSTSYYAGRSLSEGQGSRNFKSTCAASAATVPRNLAARRSSFLCHWCPRVCNVISFVAALPSLSFLWLMSLSAVGQGCARIFSRFLSLASAFVSQLDGLLLSFLCPIIL